LNGDELMHALGIAPGPLVGRLLAEIGNAHASGEISTSEEAIGLAKRLLVGLTQKQL
jgi:tRNA nucleotidyltransferase (CCA-adding enzyme)